MKLTFVVMAAIIGIMMIGGGAGGSHSSTQSTPASRYDSKPSNTPKADAFAAGAGAYMDDRERQLYEQDPSSRGYTDEDREFLKEHGVSEDEARAAETILHQQGVE